MRTILGVQYGAGVEIQGARLVYPGAEVSQGPMNPGEPDASRVQSGQRDAGTETSAARSGSLPLLEPPKRQQPRAIGPGLLSLLVPRERFELSLQINGTRPSTQGLAWSAKDLRRRVVRMVRVGGCVPEIA
jgi:hypothetical protein